MGSSSLGIMTSRRLIRGLDWRRKLPPRWLFRFLDFLFPQRRTSSWRAEVMIADGVIVARPAQEDEKAMKLLRLLSIVSRRRWPEWADKAPSVGVPPPKKKVARHRSRHRKLSPQPGAAD